VAESKGKKSTETKEERSDDGKDGEEGEKRKTERSARNPEYVIGTSITKQTPNEFGVRGLREMRLKKAHVFRNIESASRHRDRQAGGKEDRGSLYK